MQTSALPNANAPRPPDIAQLVAIADPEAEEPVEPLFVPDPAVWDWIDDHFLSSESPLLVTDHVDLLDARVGILWSNVEKRKQGQLVLGTAELGDPKNAVKDPWLRGALRQQRREWFGAEPDLLVTLYAPWCARAPAVAVAALLDHELRHFAQKLDKEGEPMYDEDTGRPVWRTVGHDSEEFVGTVAYFGAWDRGLQLMRAALNDRPLLDPVEIERAVGPPTMPWI